MVQDGIFGPERKRSNGRPKWRLVDEKLGRELDLSSMYCIPVRSKAVKKTVDADKEEWDILDGTPLESGQLESKSKDVLHMTVNSEPCRTIRKQPMRARSAIKPLGGKLTVVKPISCAAFSNSPESITEVMSTPPRLSPRWNPKDNDNDDMAPPRKARRINSAGARRCALQL